MIFFFFSDGREIISALTEGGKNDSGILAHTLSTGRREDFEAVRCASHFVYVMSLDLRFGLISWIWSSVPLFLF